MDQSPLPDSVATTLQARLETLEAVGLAISAPAPVEMILDVIADLVLEALPVEAGTIFLVEPQNEQLRFAYARGPQRECVQGLRLQPGEGIVGWSVQNNQYVIVNDVSSDPRFTPRIDEHSGFRTKSILCVPLRTRQRVIGAIELLNRTHGEFTEHDAAFLSSIANQVGHLVANVRLFEQHQEGVRTLHALRNVGKWLNSTLHIKSVLENIVRTADEVIDAEAGSLMLLDDDGHLHFEIALGPAAADIMEHREEIDKHLDEGICGLVARTGEPELVPDCSKDPRFSTGGGARVSSTIQFQTKSLLCVPMRTRGRIIGVLEVINKQNGRPFDEQDVVTLSAFAEDAAAALTNARLYESLEESYMATINSLVTALDTRDNETGGHSQRVALFAQRLAQELGLSDDEIAVVHRGSLLHDIGKIGIPDAVLRKPGKLDDDEWEIMRRHALVGYRVLEGIEFLRQPALIPLFHHERYDGGGYLAGIRGDEIPIGARIFAVVDTFDAMTSDRVYRKALPNEVARDEIRRCSGEQFDPHVAQAFQQITDRELQAIRDRVRSEQSRRGSLRADEGRPQDDADQARDIFETVVRPTL